MLPQRREVLAESEGRLLGVRFLPMSGCVHRPCGRVPMF